MSKLNSIAEAIADIKAGKLVIVVDDEARENEGDFVVAAEMATPEIINFMATEGRGIICAPLPETRCQELGLELMVNNNTSRYSTPFTIPVDLIGKEITTGVSAADRSATVQALANPKFKAHNFARPGHIFPLSAKPGGVLRRAGHTEAGVDLAQLAGLQPAAVLVEIMNADGTMARLPELIKIAKQHQLKIISIKDLIEYRLYREKLIKKEVQIKLPTKFGDFNLTAYSEDHTTNVHLALTKGEWEHDEPILVRVHSSCVTGDVLHSLRCDCGDQLSFAMEMINKQGKGVILYMNQEGRGIGLLNKLKAYQLQEEGMDTVEANLALGFSKDQRDYGIGAQILRDLNVSKIKFLTNNPRKRIGLIGYGLEIVDNVPIEIEPNEHNLKYLKTKRDKLGHSLKLISE